MEVAEYNKFVRQPDGNTATVNAGTTPEKTVLIL